MREKTRKWLWEHWKLTLLLSSGIALVIAILLSLAMNVKIGSIAGSILWVAPNLPSICRILIKVKEIMHLGIKRAKWEDKKVYALLSLYNEQANNFCLYLKTIVEKIEYASLNTTAPHLVFNVRFFNMLVIPITIKGYKIYVERTDTYQVHCSGHGYQIEPQSPPFLNSEVIEPTTERTLCVYVNIPSSVSLTIRECLENKEPISYGIRVCWNIEADGKEIVFRDYLDYSRIEQYFSGRYNG